MPQDFQGWLPDHFGRWSSNPAVIKLAMHLYRKFHARGGVRRVYATADKNWDTRLHGFWRPLGLTCFQLAWELRIST